MPKRWLSATAGKSHSGAKDDDVPATVAKEERYWRTVEGAQDRRSALVIVAKDPSRGRERMESRRARMVLKVA